MDTQNFKYIEQKLNELDELKKKIEKLYALNDIGGEVKAELEKERYLKLKENNIDIPHLDNTIGKQLFKTKQGPGVKRELSKEEILKAQEKSQSALQTARRLHVSYPTYKKYARLHGIFKTPQWGPDRKKESILHSQCNPFKGKFPINEILAGKHPDFPTHRLKDKLIRSGIKEGKCEQCGFAERRLTDGKLPLLLNYDDGDRTNHKIENLIILCYNCTFTCGKGYISRAPDKFHANSFDPDVLQECPRIQKARF